ncbi:MAG: M50 family metallopeptidase [Planctomycetota bacterium]
MQIELEPSRTQWDLKWRMFGISIRVHPLFWLIALLLNYQENLDFKYVALGIVCFFFSILLHEFGHALCQRFYGDRNNRIVLHALGGLAISRHQITVWPRIAVLLWGPGAELLLAAVVYAIGASQYGVRFPLVPFNSMEQYAMLMLFWINTIWGVGNLLPIFPLDGGQIARELARWKAPRRGDAFAFQISFYVAIVITLLVIAKALSPYRANNALGDLFSILLFGMLAYQSYMLRKRILQYGDEEEKESSRSPWEQNDDWWKHGK